MPLDVIKKAVGKQEANLPNWPAEINAGATKQCRYLTCYNLHPSKCPLIFPAQYLNHISC
jgi:hypothetical protein